jgi:hypothetical protein
LRELDRAPSRDWQHVFRWLYDRKPLDDGEYDFILHRDDFVSSGKGPQNPFERLIESCLSRWPNASFRVSKTRFLGPHHVERIEFQGANRKTAIFGRKERSSWRAGPGSPFLFQHEDCLRGKTCRRLCRRHHLADPDIPSVLNPDEQERSCGDDARVCVDICNSDVVVYKLRGRNGVR